MSNSMSAREENIERDSQEVISIFAERSFRSVSGEVDH